MLFANMICHDREVRVKIQQSLYFVSLDEIFQ